VVGAGVYSRQRRSTRTTDTLVKDDAECDARHREHHQHRPKPHRPVSSRGPTGDIEVGR
jgi:hypothetical protein